MFKIKIESSSSGRKWSTFCNGLSAIQETICGFIAMENLKYCDLIIEIREVM